MHLAICAANSKSSPWEKGSYILNLCPKVEEDGSIALGSRSQTAIHALGIYFLESKLMFPEKILPYLLKVLKSLPNAKWESENFQSYKSQKLPTPECFSFSLNCLLCDVIAISEDIATEQSIISAQMDLMETLSKLIADDNTPRDLVCQFYMPILVGSIRAFARDTNPLVFNKLFPCQLRPNQPASILTQNIEKKQGKKSKFDDSIDISTYFFSTAGTSLSEAIDSYAERHDTEHFFLSMDQLNSVFQLCKNLLLSDVPSRLDEMLLEHTITSQSSTSTLNKLPYKTYSGLLSLTLMSMLRDVLLHQKDIKEEFIKEVLQFAKQMFTSSFTDSLDQKGSASSKSNFASADKVNINFGELSVANTSVSVQLVLWATADESDAEEVLLHRIAEKINGNHNLKYILLQLPLVVTCIEMLGAMAEKFPGLANAIVTTLREFLVSPSPIIDRLNRHSEVLSGKKSSSKRGTPAKISLSSDQDDRLSTVSMRSSVANKITDAFFQLRNVAMKNVCTALRSGLNEDSDCILAFLASLSNRLYIAEDNDRESQLISTNAILTLGYVGVNLRYTQNRRTVQLVMQIFQQRFCTPPSALDAIIVDQMANIVIAGCSCKCSLRSVWRVVKPTTLKELAMCTSTGLWLERLLSLSSL
ncbi:hypothetical protein EB796_010520 [Bugula neritina]|uniref:PI4-kinase N-terminal domain-containing protein n=1 Tax=Bugula neritina TaxID=10212 RepID=A0A7J7JXT6_BUGNE|nr:hypothetical protein EB796_010520 [Bugula neritina]